MREKNYFGMKAEVKDGLCYCENGTDYDLTQSKEKQRDIVEEIHKDFVNTLGKELKKSFGFDDE